MFGVAGRLLDKFGVRVGMIWAVIVWSSAAASHAFARSALGFSISRLRSARRGANFPACIKPLPNGSRNATGSRNRIFNRGSNVGMMLSPLIVWVATVWHWQRRSS